MAKKKNNNVLMWVILAVVVLILFKADWSTTNALTFTDKEKADTSLGGNLGGGNGGQNTLACTDSDGDNRDVPGHVTYGDVYTDKCLEVGQAITEYVCLNGVVSAKNEACDLGETCIQSRSGGYCKTSTPTWKPGDTVWTGSGGASTIGMFPQTSSIDLGDYGITADGNCRLGVQLQTSWHYANDNCVGLQGSQGVKWDFYDSSGLEYTRTDTVPVSLGVDLHPEEHILNWDGNTNWVASMTPSPFPLPLCSITYEYTARIYIYDCN